MVIGRSSFYLKRFIDYSSVNAIALKRTTWFSNKACHFRRTMSCDVVKRNGERITLAFLHKGKRFLANAKVGESLLEVKKKNNLDIDGFGVCGGFAHCSTCHVIFKQEDFEAFSFQLSDEEMDLLDNNQEACTWSRLSCQVLVTKDMDGIELNVPDRILDVRDS